MIGCIRAAAPYGPAVGTERAERFAARFGRRAGDPPSPASPGTGARANVVTTSDRLAPRHLSQGAPFEGGSDAATRWNSTGEGFASVPEPPYGSLARPVDGRASCDSGGVRVLPDRRRGGAVYHHVRTGRDVMSG